MPTTFTIKQIPDSLAERLRRRAEVNRRSLQKELLSIMEGSVEWTEIPAFGKARVAEPPAPDYASTPSHKTLRLSLDEAWQRARKLGVASRSAGAVIAGDEELLEKAAVVVGSGERTAVLREGLIALIEREAARRLIRLGGAAPDARRPPRRRPAAMRKTRHGA